MGTLTGTAVGVPSIEYRPPRAERAAGAGRSRRRFSGAGLLRLVSPILLVGLWQLLSSTGVLPASRLVSPATIAHTAYSLVVTSSPTYGTLQGSLLVSAERWGIGFGLGVTIAVLLAILTGLSRIAETALDPIVQALRSIPLLGMLPLFIIWFGIGELPKIILIATAAALPIYVNVYAGIKQTDPQLIEATTALGYPRWQRLWHVVLPSAVPHTLVGVRLGIASAWLALVVAETIASDQGIGFMINNAREFLRTDIVIVGILTYAVVGLLMDTIVRLIERRILRWRTP